MKYGDNAVEFVLPNFNLFRTGTVENLGDTCGDISYAFLVEKKSEPGVEVVEPNFITYSKDVDG